jgi:oleate hydratase
MYYSSGNYEAFARPRKPKGVDEKSAYIVGAGLAGLSAAAFLIRDAQMDGKRIRIIEAAKLPGGAMDGIKDPRRGFMCRGERELEDHMECLWDLFRSIPSLEVEGASVLDEFYWLDKDDPNINLRRTTQNRGEPHETDGMLTLSKRAQGELIKLSLTREEDLDDKKISDVLGRDLFDSNYWIYWRTMFGFEEWHSALEMKRYINRFIHHLAGLANLSVIKFTRYNQYESLILPLVAWLERHGVTFQYDTRVTNVVFSLTPDRGPIVVTPHRKVARRIQWIRDGMPGGCDLTENDLVFITNGSCVENSSWGDHHTPAVFDQEIREGSIWALWRNIARQDASFGRPEKFCAHADQSTWQSATITVLDDKIHPYIEKIAQRDPLASNPHIVTGGIVTVRDSSWLLSWNMERQPHFKAQPQNQLVGWMYGLFPDRPGNFVKKSMMECTGEEIAREWLYHIGAPLDQIPQLAATSTQCVPCIMPFITAFFMPRRAGDRPAIVPEHAVNFAFIGQFAETERDCIFTTEYSVRTAMEAVYTLLNVERGVPETWGSVYDIRAVLNAASLMRDGEPLEAPELIMKLLDPTDIGGLLRKYDKRAVPQRKDRG